MLLQDILLNLNFDELVAMWSTTAHVEFTGPLTDALFKIGSKDHKIQNMVSEAMSESSDGNIDVKRLALRTLYVCLREAMSF